MICDTFLAIATSQSANLRLRHGRTFRLGTRPNRWETGRFECDGALGVKVGRRRGGGFRQFRQFRQHPRLQFISSSSLYEASSTHNNAESRDSKSPIDNAFAGRPGTTSWIGRQVGGHEVRMVDVPTRSAARVIRCFSRLSRAQSGLPRPFLKPVASALGAGHRVKTCDFTDRGPR